MKTLIITIIFSLTTITNSQVTQEWMSVYNGQSNAFDLADVIVVDNAGNVYVTGYSANGTSYECATIKYNSAGAQQWLQAYNGPGNSDDYGRSIAVDASGNVYVGGQSSSVSGQLDYLAIKYNSTGVQQWVRTYNGTGNANDIAYSIAVDASGNVYVTGVASASVFTDVVTIKYNSAGVEQWLRSYNGTGNNSDGAYSMAIDAPGNVYVTGSTRTGTNTDYATIKYNSAGVEQWVSRYDGPSAMIDIARSIKVDASGNSYVAGSSQTGGSQTDFLTIKYNSSGAEQWASRYQSPNAGCQLRDMVIDVSGNCYLTGLKSSGLGTEDCVTLKYNSSGAQQWVQIYNGPDNSTDFAESIAVNDSGNVFITGGSSGPIGGGCITILYNAAGVEQWVQRYTSSTGRALTIDGSGNIYVTGNGLGIGSTNSDYVTIKYSQIIGIQQIGIEVPNDFSLSQNYPNPFNPVTNIEFSVPKFAFVRLAIFDVSGQEIKTLVNQNMIAGTYKADWDASKYSSGIYFFTITSGSFRETKKMILVK